MNIFDEEECTKILKEAYEEGYRLFDCAQIYGNEQIVGSALRKAGIPRDELFLTTKVWFTNFEGEEVRKSLLESMRKLQSQRQRSAPAPCAPAGPRHRGPVRPSSGQ